MKIKLLSFIIALLQLSTYAQTPAIEWKKCFGGTDSDSFSNIKQTSDGGYIVVGASRSNNGDLILNKGNNDVWILKLNFNFVTEWSKSYGGTKEDYADCVQQTTDGGYIITGYSESNDGDATSNHGSYHNGDFWTIKTNAKGVIEWQKSLGGSQAERSYSIIQTNDGYVVTGTSSSNDGDVSGLHGYGTTNADDASIIKLDVLGNVIWQKLLGGTESENSSSVKQTTDGGIILCGRSRSNDGDVSINKGSSDAWIVKLNGLGIIEWEKTFGGSNTDSAKSISQTSDGGFIVIGSSSSTDGDVIGNYSNERDNVWVLKLNINGDIQWQKIFSGSETDEGTDIQQTSDGGYILTAQTYSSDKDLTENKGYSDAWIVKLNQKGELQWQKSIGGNSYDRIESIQQTVDGSYIMAGYTFSTDGDIINNNGNGDGWIVKLVSSNLSLNNFESNKLIIYPNPVTSILNFQIPNKDIIDKIIITDINGKKILEQNKNTTQIDTQELNSGTYFITVFSSDKKYTQKILRR
ncbi:MAG TPA: T9SS type A sorting domain-containing protein [Flavobacterium sp.]|uniref:T9SS type A sorting domain-containing protein n=1 Tax=Flavobacterium sp. TaxID=239 RepID=UPI002DBF8900|nr:T9SS type A sorting domain-containing protein [Flavobacterium sp.]HEU4790305.1 T9SS type A sorting domain-containing protein [Flavobacterium sp.]